MNILMNVLMILLTLLILSILVVVHEWGHYIAAKKLGVFVEEFSIGMGPLVFSKQGKETQFSIRAFPLGGFCKMRGEGDADVEDENQEKEKQVIDPDDPRSFSNKSKSQRFIILVAGATMNIIFAYVCLVIIFLMKGTSLWGAISNAFLTTGNFAGTIYQSLYMLITGKVGMNDIAGPIGMVTMVQSFFQYGFIALMSFTALISVNLGVINLLPLPALDGGQIFIIIIEKIVGRDLDPKKANMINYIGFMALMLLAVVIAVNDVMRLIH
ncbi:MAG: site-2 protease family protein [Eubacterium sp.]